MLDSRTPRLCGARAWWRQHQKELSRRCHPESRRYSGIVPDVLVCQLRPHNRDQRHAMAIRFIPEDYGGGKLVALWGKDCHGIGGLSFVHVPRGSYSLNRRPLGETLNFH